MRELFIFREKPSNEDKRKELDELFNALKEFVLNNEDFFNLAKEYSFYYQEFSPYSDYCEVHWDKKSKKWDFIGHYRHSNEVSEKLPEKKNTFFLSLSIAPYNWGSLFSEMEFWFVKDLEKTMNQEEIDVLTQKNYDKYVQLRNDYFNKNKLLIIDNWFQLDETTISDYLKSEYERLTELILFKKMFL